MSKQDIQKLRNQIMEKYPDFEPVVNDRILQTPHVPDSITEFLSHSLNNINVRIPSYMYSQLQLLDCDELERMQDTNFAHCLFNLIAVENKFDGSYTTLSGTFTGRSANLQGFDGIYYIQVTTKQKLSKCILQIHADGYETVIIDYGTLVSSNNDEYVYSFLQFKDTDCVLPGVPLRKYSIEIDENVEASFTSKEIYLSYPIRKQFINGIQVIPITPFDNKHFVAFPSVMVITFDLEKNTYRQVGSINNREESISQFIENGRRVMRQNKIKNITGPCTITKINKSTDNCSFTGCGISLQLYKEKLELTDLISKYPQYTLDNNFIMLDDKDVSYENFNDLCPNSELTVSNLGYGIGIIRGIDPVPLTEFDFPMDVLNIRHGEKGIEINLLNGQQILFYKNDRMYKVSLDNKTLYNFYFTSRLEQFKDEFTEELETICFMCKRDCKHPDLDLFKTDTGSCYVYWNGLEYLTMPPQLHYVVPSSYKEKAIAILEENGFSIQDC